MWFLGGAIIKATEYESAHASTRHSHLLPGLWPSGKMRKGSIAVHDISVTPGKIIGAFARSGATLCSNSTIGFWRAAGATARFQEAVRRVKTEVRASENLIASLRDSTRTALSGELGQAMTWLLAIDHFCSSSVIDFGNGCTQLGVVSPGPEDMRPDFMASIIPFFGVALFESKGSIINSTSKFRWAPDIKYGLTQTGAGRDWLAVHGIPGYVSRELSVSFALSETDASTIVFADPDEPQVKPLTDSQKLAFLRSHFAAWATAGGALNLARALYGDRSGSDIIKMVNDLPRIERGGRGMLVASVDTRIDYLTLGRISHGADEGVLRAVAEGNLDSYVEELRKFRMMLDEQEEALIPVRYGRLRNNMRDALFKDGTVAIFRSLR